MPKILDWRRTANAPALAQFAAQTLAEGALVALPTETGYSLAASALLPEAVARLRHGTAGPNAPAPTPALGSAADAPHWTPDLGRMGRRLSHRLWPGPLTLVCNEGVENGLAYQLSEAVRRMVCSESGDVRLRAPDSEVLQEVLRRLPGPLLLAGENGPSSASLPPLRTAQELAESSSEEVDLVLDNGPCPYAQPTTVVIVRGKDWQVSVEGVLPAALIAEQAACRILFVCTGNTCRSPLAEALCKRRLADRLGCAVDELPSRGFVVLSAGLAAIIGSSAAPEAIATAQTYGTDLAAHASRPVTADLISQADYVLAMTQSHLLVLFSYFPESATFARLLSPDGEDITDPLGCDREVYEECARTIWACLEAFVEEAAAGG